VGAQRRPCRIIRIEIKLGLEPGLAPLQDVRAALLGRVGGLFLRVMAWRLKKRWIARATRTRRSRSRISARQARCVVVAM